MRRVRAAAAGALLTACIGFGPTALVHDASAAFPGRNGRILFEVTRDPIPNPPDNSEPLDLDLFTVLPTGAGVQQLTEGPAADLHPAWSMDSRRIAFSRELVPLILPDIYVVNADGSGIANLTDSPLTYDRRPSWSPDGSRIAFDSVHISDFADGDFVLENIYVMEADGSNVVQLTDVGANTGPAWSPDGAWIAYSHLDFNTGIDMIRLISPDGSRLRTVTKPGIFAEIGATSWSPDGRYIAFNAKRTDLNTPDSDSDVWVIRRNGAGLTNLTGESHARDLSPAWSPNGKQIAFISDREDDVYKLYKMNADGSHVVKLIDLTLGWTGRPDWGPRP